jgi:hypothetical protein
MTIDDDFLEDLANTKPKDTPEPEEVVQPTPEPVVEEVVSEGGDVLTSDDFEESRLREVAQGLADARTIESLQERIERKDVELEDVIKERTSIYESRAAHYQRVLGNVLSGAFGLFRRAKKAEEAVEGEAKKGLLAEHAKSKVEKDLASKQQEYDALQRNKVELEEKLENATGLYKKVVNERDAALGLVEEGIAQHAELEKQKDVLEEDRDRIAGEYRELRSSYESLEARAGELERDLTGTSQGKERLDSELDTTKAELEEVRRDLADKTRELLEAGEAIVQKDSQIGEYDSKVVGLTSALAERAKELRIAEGQAWTEKELRDYVIDAVDKNLKSYISRDRLVAIVREELDENISLYNVVPKENLDELRGELDSNVRLYGEKVNELNELRNRYEALVGDNKAVNEEADELRRRIGELTSTIETLNQEGKELLSKFEDYKIVSESRAGGLTLDGADQRAKYLFAVFKDVINDDDYEADKADSESYKALVARVISTTENSGTDIENWELAEYLIDKFGDDIEAMASGRFDVEEYIEKLEGEDYVVSTELEFENAFEEMLEAVLEGLVTKEEAQQEAVRTALPYRSLAEQLSAEIAKLKDELPGIIRVAYQAVTHTAYHGNEQTRKGLVATLVSRSGLATDEKGDWYKAEELLKEGSWTKEVFDYLAANLPVISDIIDSEERHRRWAVDCIDKRKGLEARNSELEQELGSTRADLGVSESRRKGFGNLSKLLYKRLSEANRGKHDEKNTRKNIERRLDEILVEAEQVVQQRDEAQGRASTAEEHNIELRGRVRDLRRKYGYSNEVLQGISRLEGSEYEVAVGHFERALRRDGTVDAKFYLGLAKALNGQLGGYGLIDEVERSANDDQLGRFSRQLIFYAESNPDLHKQAAKYLEIIEERVKFSGDKVRSEEIAYLLGVQHIAAGQSEKAINALKRSLKDPDRLTEDIYVERVFALGEAFEIAGYERKAKKEFKTVLEFDPKHKEAYVKVNSKRGWFR